MHPHDTTFYVYVLCRPDGRPFYVGKGSGTRYLDHEGEARIGHKCHKCNTIRKIWQAGGQVVYLTKLTTESEQEAYDEEKRLIALYGRKNLTNATDGGEGQSGRKGALAGAAKLTWEQVNEIRRRYAEETTPLRTIAQDYGISLATLEKIVSQEHWHTDPSAPTKRDPRLRLQNSPHGEQQHCAKLTWEAVREIRAKYGDGTVDNRTIAAHYGVTPRVIRLVLLNQAWHDPSYDPSTYVPFKPRAAGERNRHAILTWDDVRAVRAAYRPRIVTVPMLAKQYGVSIDTIEKIVSKRTWRE